MFGVRLGIEGGRVTEHCGRGHHLDRLPRTILRAQLATDANFIIDEHAERRWILSKLNDAIWNGTDGDADLASSARGKIDVGLDLCP